MNNGNGNRFVFLDPFGKRWTRMRLMALVLTMVIFVCAVIFVRALFVMPRLTPPAFQARLKALAQNAPVPPSVSKRLWTRFARPTPQPHRAPSTRADIPIRLAFTAGWDPNSLRSFERHADQFTHVCPEWFSLLDGQGGLRADPDSAVQKIAAKQGIALLPLLRNLMGDTWQPEAVEALANGPAERRERFIRNLIGQLRDMEASGVAIEWGQVDPSYAPKVTLLLRQMAEALHTGGLELWLCIPMGLEFKLYELEKLSPYVDRFIAMLHDETGEEDAPGPLASQPWFEGWLDTVTAYGRPFQWVVAVGAYGYDWAQGEDRAEAIGFADAMSRAGRSGLPHCDYPSEIANPRYEYDAAGRTHQVWFLDAGTFLNQLRTAQRKEIGGFALSRLGTEDPGVWEALRLAQNPRVETADLARLNVIPTEEIATHIGRGEFLTVADDRADGRRRVAQLPNGLVTMHYERFPAYLTVWHQGQAPDDAVALSFDDGPDPHWTPRILDILKASGAKAAFFMVGGKMEEHPELVRRIYAEGHEMGVHTYTHTDLSEASVERVRLELNATQRLIEKITGHSTVLFRPPYKADNHMTRPKDILPIRIAQELGYLTVTNTIDSQDYTRPGVAAILNNVQTDRVDGNIILLHDAGGDRRQTVQALPLILDWLYERGDRVLPLSDLLRLPPEQLMPATRPQGQEMARMLADSGFDLLHAAEELVWAFMIVATLLVVLRTLVVAALAAGHRRRPRGIDGSAVTDFHPPVSVLIPAYNEAKVIGRTLSTVLASGYPGPIEVVVVDDGSKDDTSAQVQAMAAGDPRLRLIRQPNQGKAAALQLGMTAVGRDIVITLDADTHFAPDTIGRLAAHFQDNRVAAVSGHVRVGNLRTFIARCQELEYICGFNLERRAYHQLNCITVVPGAVSAWRRDAVLAAGGISGDTLAEDTDLTLSFHRSGWRVTYEPNAKAWTEAPESIPTLVRQRFRWAFGTLQCLWKHRDLLFQPKHGALAFFSLPGVWFFQILLVAIVPLVDLTLMLSLLFGGGGAVWTFFAIFLSMDLALALLACGLEGEPLRQAWICLPMRLLYRPLLGWVVWKSIFKAFKGAWVGWGKLERTASVPMAGAQRP